jgi:hypothetical protein
MAFPLDCGSIGTGDLVWEHYFVPTKLLLVALVKKLKGVNAITSLLLHKT